MSLVHQETWVRHGTNGIGISDHQNRYSNGVRVANWVENECGDVLKVRKFFGGCKTSIHLYACFFSGLALVRTGVSAGSWWLQENFGLLTVRPCPVQATASDHVRFTGISTVQADFIQRDRDPDNNRVTALGSSSNVQMVSVRCPAPHVWLYIYIYIYI